MCAKVTLRSFIIDLYKRQSGIPITNSLKWLTEFIEFMQFNFYRHKCFIVTKAHKPMASAVQVLSDADIYSKIGDFLSKITSIENLLSQLKMDVAKQPKIDASSLFGLCIRAFSDDGQAAQQVKGNT